MNYLQWVFIGFIYLPSAFAGSMSVMYSPQERSSALGKCFDRYKGQLRDQNRLIVGVTLGYSDTADEKMDLVMDGWLMRKVTYHLTKPCEYQGQGFCDFRIVRDGDGGPSLYERRLVGPNGDEVSVDFWLMSSSYSEFDSENQGLYRSQQKDKSERARSFFEWTLNTADAVFYEGHSRDGGGPDFAPPRTRSNGKVDYPWYRKNQPGLKFLLGALKKAQAPNLYFGLFSCSSEKHFRKSLSPFFANTKMILSTKVISAEKTKESLLTALESLLNFECPEDMRTRISPFSFVVR